MEKKKLTTIATLVLFIMTIIWGLAFIGVSDALNNGWGTFPIVFLRSIIGALVVFPFTIKKSYRNKDLFKKGINIGVSAFGGYTLQTYGQSMTTVGATAFITSLYIILVPLILRILFRKRESWVIYLASFIAVIGCLLLNLKLPLSFDKENLLGNGLVLLGALCFAIQIITIAKYTQEHDVLQLTFIELVTMAFLALIAMSIINDFSFKVEGLFSVVWVGLLSSGLCSVSQMWGEKHLHASVSGIIMSLESVFGAIFALIFFDEHLTLIQAIGCTLILIPVLMCQIPIKPKEKIELEDEIKEESS